MQKDIINKHSLFELALLAIFAGGLFWANQIVKSRAKIQLGEGYQVPGGGLKVYWPAEKGWQGLTQWQLEQNNRLVLPARLTRPVVEVQWVYGFSTTAASSEALLEQLAGEYNGVVIDRSTIQGGVVMASGRLNSETVSGCCYLGAVVLDFGRTLTLRVQSADDYFYAHDIFKALAGSIEYSKPADLAAGIELIEAMRRDGAQSLLNNRDRNLMIVDMAGSVRGYESVQTRAKTPESVHISQTLVINTAAVRRKDYTFDSNDLFDTFHWQNYYSNSAGQGGVFQIHLKDNVLTVQEPAAQVQTIQPSAVMVCEILLDDVIQYLADRPDSNVVLDVLSSEGRIVPCWIQVIPAAQALKAPQKTAYAVRAESLGGVIIEFYFDDGKNLLGKISMAAKGGTLIWRPTTRQEIEKYFDTRPVRKGPVA